jgi:hypothetical protein
MMNPGSFLIVMAAMFFSYKILTLLITGGKTQTAKPPKVSRSFANRDDLMHRAEDLSRRLAALEEIIHSEPEAQGAPR